MGFFQSVRESVSSGVDAVSRAGSSAADWAKTKANRTATNLIDSQSKKILDDPELRNKLLDRARKQREQFSSTLCQDCGNPNSNHPDKRDGQYMGADCPSTHASKPAQGALPDKCGHAKNGKMMFTNGINNDTKQVCETMKALATSRCMEVVGVFNATYADKSLKVADRRKADYKEDAAAGVAKGKSKAITGGLTGAGLGLLAGGPIGAAVNAAKGAAAGFGKGMFSGAAPGMAATEAGRLGMVQDVLDCIDTVAGSGTEAASATLSKEIVAAVSGGQPINLFAHSQGGLNTAAAIAQAKGELIAAKSDALQDSGMSKSAANVAATKSVEQQLAKNVQVHTFGTMEQGFVDGPQYVRTTNTLDPVPKLIRNAQNVLSPDQALANRDPAGAAKVDSFEAAHWDPMAAHGMSESYIPHLDKAHPAGKCC